MAAKTEMKCPTALKLTYSIYPSSLENGNKIILIIYLFKKSKITQTNELTDITETDIFLNIFLNIFI